MKNQMLKPLVIAIALVLVPLSISTAQATQTNQGSKGDKGDRGDKGDNGDKGQIGPQGPAGPQGLQGVPGVAGATGPIGATGAKGDTGPAGSVGPAGVPGAIGLTGLTGAAGPQGAPGAKGDTGATGPKGTGASVHVIGEHYQGGIVFWVDADGQHGLIASESGQTDNNNLIRWDDANNTIQRGYNTGARGDGIYAGIHNTAIIVAQQYVWNTANALPVTPASTTPVSSAAQVAADYSVQEDGLSPCTNTDSYADYPNTNQKCFGDWYLPSLVELKLFYNFASNNRDTIWYGGQYWSSTEASRYPFSQLAWQLNFYNGSPTAVEKYNGRGYVRVVRAF